MLEPLAHRPSAPHDSVPLTHTARPGASFPLPSTTSFDTAARDSRQPTTRPPECPASRRGPAIKFLPQLGFLGEPGGQGSVCVGAGELRFWISVATVERFADDLLATGVQKLIVQPFHFRRGKFVAGTRNAALAITADEARVQRRRDDAPLSESLRRRTARATP